MQSSASLSMPVAEWVESLKKLPAGEMLSELTDEAIERVKQEFSDIKQLYELLEVVDENYEITSPWIQKLLMAIDANKLIHTLEDFGQGIHFVGFYALYESENDVELAWLKSMTLEKKKSFFLNANSLQDLLKNHYFHFLSAKDPVLFAESSDALDADKLRSLVQDWGSFLKIARVYRDANQFISLLDKIGLDHLDKLNELHPHSINQLTWSDIQSFMPKENYAEWVDKFLTLDSFRRPLFEMYAFCELIKTIPLPWSKPFSDFVLSVLDASAQKHQKDKYLPVREYPLRAVEEFFWKLDSNNLNNGPIVRAYLELDIENIRSKLKNVKHLTWFFQYVRGNETFFLTLLGAEKIKELAPNQDQRNDLLKSLPEERRGYLMELFKPEVQSEVAEAAYTRHKKHAASCVSLFKHKKHHHPAVQALGDEHQTNEVIKIPTIRQ